MNKQLFISLVFCALIIGGAVWLVSARPNAGAGPVATSPTATTTDGKQIIDITAKGGYSPRQVNAKAGIPTIVRVTTNGTFDCSASLVIPKLSYQKFLKPSGTEEISLTADQAQGTLQGLCAMGMYNFKIIFQ
ncbi:MAG: cupredoxin domain-containing protein [Candidatus Paceibacterota bacterium]|jgi:plastocyanin domain-containing protein